MEEQLLQTGSRVQMSRQVLFVPSSTRSFLLQPRTSLHCDVGSPRSSLARLACEGLNITRSCRFGH